MTTMPPQPPQPAQPQPPGGQPKKRGWIAPVAIIGAVVLAVCCIGGIAIVALTGDVDNDEPDIAAEPDEPDTEPDEDAAPEAEPQPEPAGFGAGVWEIDTEIPAGTYVTIAPDGTFDSCYWARLSGFSGDFDDIITNGNLNAGARGRIAIDSDDAGVEFSGPCEWVDVSEAAPVDIGDEVGEGVWAIDEEIQPGTYTTEAGEGAFESCYWARLSGFSGDFDDIITNGNIEPGSRGRIEISSSDAGAEFSGDCTWTRN